MDRQVIVMTIELGCYIVLMTGVREWTVDRQDI